MVGVVKDWFHLKNLGFNFEYINAEVMPQLVGTEWKPTHYSQAEGTTWCMVDLSSDLIGKIENAVNCKIYPDFYIWNYLDVKELSIHKDTNTPGQMRNIVGCIPLEGSFECRVYDDKNHEEPLDKCIYGPGDLLILNNTKYSHGGTVLSNTRLSLHFYLDFFNTDNRSLSELLEINQIK